MTSNRSVHRISFLVLILALAAVALRPQVAEAARIEGRLEFLRTAHRAIAAGDLDVPEVAIAARAETGAATRSAILALNLAAAPTVSGSIRFLASPTSGELAELAALGVEFTVHGAGRQGSRTVYPARWPFSILDAIAAHPAVAALDCAWRPLGARPLANSVPQVEAPAAWQVSDDLGHPVFGTGVLIADLDTGVDYYHPAFFRPDDHEYTWLDEDGSGDLSNGDAVDLDGDGLAGPGEGLAYQEAMGTAVYGNQSGFDPRFDWLFNDQDDDGTRDYGAPAFGELDPCYGEQVFYVRDLDGDDVLDPGEPLLSLGESKVAAVRDRDGTVHRRGVDLLAAERDTWGHGTQVSGICAGGWPYRHAMAGLAPGAELVHANIDWTASPPFIVPLEDHLLWAAGEGADIILVEDGEWLWQFMDGSSNVEIMLNELAADDGLSIVVPAGNLATGQMHTAVPGDATTTLQVVGAHHIWISFLSTDPDQDWWPVSVAPPGGVAVVLPLDAAIVQDQGHAFYGHLSTSSRQTRRLDVWIHRDNLAAINGTWTFTLGGSATTEVHGYYLDDVSGWSTASSWEDLDRTRTVTWPATADSAISVTAYSAGNDGDIDSYSGWGPRIDGRTAVDLAAPGLVVYAPHPFTPGNYTAFGGTSGAGPHVAGALALLRQLDPSLGSGDCRRLLHQAAAQDEFTDDPHRWGAGKLRLGEAVAGLVTEVADTPTRQGFQVRAFPNPFNPRTTLRFRQPAAGPAEVRVFSVDGRLVWSRLLADAPSGWREVRWNGRDHAGHGLASGLYLAHVRQGERVSAVRLTLVR